MVKNSLLGVGHVMTSFNLWLSGYESGKLQRAQLQLVFLEPVGMVLEVC